MAYNPFNKPLGEVLTAIDLQDLITNQVREGLYIEYKGDIFPSNDKIGHSIASLANTYGGWYIVGIETDAHNVAINVCGFSLTNYPDPIDKVRNIVKDHIDPMPVFYPEVIDLGADRAVLAVFVPGEQETPFITKDGRLYRRVSDSSAPIAENNRYAIDRLYDNGREVAKRFERFCRDDRTFSKAESEQGWLNIFIWPYPSGIIYKPELTSFSSIEKLLELSKTAIKIPFGNLDMIGNLPFNSGQPTLDSVILKQVQPGNLVYNNLTVKLFNNGAAKFFVPIQYFPLSSILRDSDPTKSSHFRLLGNILGLEKEAAVLKFVDLSQMWSSIATLITFYQTWLGKETWLLGFKFGMELRGVWRSVAVMDDPKWVEHIEKFGVPIINHDCIKIPNQIGEGVLLDSSQGFELEKTWIRLCTTLGQEFGLPGEVLVGLFSEYLVNKVRFVPALPQ